jgi:hypothetical protein
MKMTLNTLNEILRGTVPQRIQPAGLMQVIPLTSEYSDNRFAMPNRLVVSTTSYGSLVFRNPTKKPALIPKDVAYVTKRRNQDHTLPHVGFVKEDSFMQYDDAACIQEEQGGLMEPEARELIILPFNLRQVALGVRAMKSYNKLWPAICNFNRVMGLRATGHVDIFLEQFAQQLERFVAEFEPLPKQVGAIVLINGKVAGIERVPSYDYWLKIWSTLIRECYGSRVLYIQKKEENPNPLPTRLPLGQADSIADLITELQRVNTAEDEAARQIVRDLMNEPVTVEREAETMLSLTVETLQSSHFVGQSVRDGLQVVYASMVATEQRLAMEPEAVAAFAI